MAGGAVQNFHPGADIAADWWSLFQSPELDQLIAAGLANNPTLAAAQYTLLEARENTRAEQGNFAPSLGVSLQAEREMTSSAQTASFGGGAATAADTGFSNSPFTLFNASLSVSYAPDVFGGERRRVESLAAQATYQRYELEAAYLSLTANIVTAAISEASYRGQIDATDQIIASEQHQLRILNQQVSLGGVAPSEVISQQATLATTEATLPPLQSALARQRNQLAALTGSLPADFHAADFTLATLHLPGDLPVSLPSQLVAQRPDIQAAAAQLHEASANVGVATANMLPQITLSAGYGHESLGDENFFTPQTLLWSLVAGLTQPIFEGGRLTAQRKSAIAALHVTGAQYQQTVLTAFQNVADALQVLQFDASTLAADQLAETTAGHSLAIIQSQVQLGSQPFTAILTAQTTYQNAVIARVQAEASRLADTAALYQALGGGWWHRQDVAAPAADCCGIIP